MTGQPQLQETHSITHYLNVENGTTVDQIIEQYKNMPKNIIDIPKIDDSSILTTHRSCSTQFVNAEERSKFRNEHNIVVLKVEYSVINKQHFDTFTSMACIVMHFNAIKKQILGVDVSKINEITEGDDIIYDIYKKKCESLGISFKTIDNDKYYNEEASNFIKTEVIPLIRDKDIREFTEILYSK